MRRAMTKRLICFVVAGMMVAPNIVYATDSIKKDESVYVNMYEDGSIKDETVSDWLHSDSSAVEIHDKSNLSAIKNIKGDEKPEKSGEDITWKSDKNDIFYEGKTSEKLPLNVNIKYYLDDKEVKIKDIAGKSGSFKIKMSFKNSDVHTKVINGKTKNIYTPIVAAALVILPMENFTNIDISDGQIVAEGNNQVISFVAFPGMQESLGISTNTLNIKLPEEITIKADAKNFKMLPIVVTATPKLPEIKALKDAKNADELKNGISDLKDATSKLTDGTGKLYDGSVQIKSGVVKLGGVIIEAKNGASMLETGIAQAKNKVSLAGNELSNPSVMSKLALISDNNKVTAERKLINDAFAAEKIPVDKELIGFIKSVATETNINKVLTSKKDVEAFIKYLESDPQVQAVIKKWSVLTPKAKKQYIQSSIMNFSKLINATDGLSKIDMTKLNPLLGLIYQSDKLLALTKSARELGKVSLPKMSEDDIAGLKMLTNLQTKQSLLAAIANTPEPQKQQLTAAIEGYYKTAVNTQNMLPSIENLRAMQAQLKANDGLLASIEGAMSKENIGYAKAVLGQVTTLQGILKDNASNIAIAKLLVSKLNDEKVMAQLDKLNGEIGQIKQLTDNIEKQLSPEQKQKYNGEIQAIISNPAIIDSVMSMQKDLTDNKKILEVVNDALQAKNVNRARQLLAAAPELNNGINMLYEGSSKLSNGMNQLVIQGVNPLIDGINTFVEKTGELNSGVNKFDSKVTPMVTDVNDVLATKDALYELSDKYSTFTGKGEAMIGNVKFIMKTDEVKAPDVKKIKTKKADATSKKKLTFIQWLKNIF